MTDPEEHLTENGFRPADAAREGAYDEQLRFDSPLMRPPALVRMVVKRDGREEPFDKTKIADAILRAADTVGEGDRDRAMSLASGYLSRKLMVRPPAGPVKKIVGGLLQLGVTSLLGMSLFRRSRDQ